MAQIEMAQNGFVILDPRFRFSYINRTAEQLLRKPRTELLGKVIWDEYPGHVGTELDRQFRRVMKHRMPAQIQNYYARLQTWYEFQINPSPQGIAIWFRDITETKRLQDQAEHSAATLSALMDNVPEGMTIVNASTGRVELVSRYSAELSRRAREDLIGTPALEYGKIWRILRPDGSMPEPEELPVSRAAKGQVVVNEEWLLERGDGIRIDVLYNAAPIRDLAGVIIGTVIVWRDITDRKAQQDLRAESRRIAMAATLAGGVAHRLNNLLTAIVGNVAIVNSRFSASDPDHGLLSNALEAADQAADLTRKLLAFVGKSVFTLMESVDLCRYVRNIEGEIRALVPDRIAVHFDLDAQIPYVKADPEQIREALISLLVNAIEAIGEEPGTIRIIARVHTLKREFLQRLRNGSSLQPGEYVSLAIRDTGGGIEPQYRDRIFEPFFSTKLLGRGLGLAAVDGIARSHYGAVEVASELGSGTVFRVYFPAESSNPASLRLDPHHPAGHAQIAIRR